MFYKDKDKLQTTMPYWNHKNRQKIQVKTRKV